MRLYLHPPADGLDGASLARSPASAPGGAGSQSVGNLFGGEEMDYRLLDSEAFGMVILDEPLSLTLTATRSSSAPAPLYLSASLIVRRTRTGLLPGEIPDSEEPTTPPETPPVGVAVERTLWSGPPEEVEVGSSLFMAGRSAEVAPLGRAGYDTELFLRLRLTAGAGAENFPATLGVSSDNYLQADVRRGAATFFGLHTRERFRFFTRAERLFFFTRDSVSKADGVPLSTRDYFRGENELRLYTRDRLESESGLALFTRERTTPVPGSLPDSAPCVYDLVVNGSSYGVRSPSGHSREMRELVSLENALNATAVKESVVEPPLEEAREIARKRASFDYLGKAADALLGAVSGVGIAASPVPGSLVEVILPSDTDASDGFVYDQGLNGSPSWRLAPGYDPDLVYPLVIASEHRGAANSGLVSGSLLATWREPQGEIVTPVARGVAGERVFRRVEPSGVLCEVYHWDRPPLTRITLTRTEGGEEEWDVLVVHVRVRNPSGSRPGFVMRRAALCVG